MSLAKKVIRITLTTFTMLLTVSGFTQVKNQEATILFYNVAFGGITSGVGSCINKPKGTKLHKAFIRGFWQGSIGGLINYSAKKTLHLVYRKENTAYALPATLLNAAGYSIIENAALHKPFLRNWTIDYGFLRFDFSVITINDFKVRLLPESIYATVDVARSGKFDLGTSLLTGSIAFKAKKSMTFQNNGLIYNGYSSGRAFVYVDRLGSNKHHIIAHELIHYYQYRDYQIFNAWLHPIGRKIKSSFLNSIFAKYIYLDLPYYWPFYNIADLRPGNNYYKNFYEFEAERFSTNRYVPVK